MGSGRQGAAMGFATRHHVQQDEGLPGQGGGRPTSPHSLVIEAPKASVLPVIALGAELKNTVCLLDGRRAKMSEALGGLNDAPAYRRFLSHVEDMRRRLGGRELVLAHDQHPGFLSTAYARRSGARSVAVQHHHAHVVSCMAEHGVAEPAIGLSCDGTGYGTDGAIWGGEILRSTLAGFERTGHLRYFHLPGGDAAARETWRPALSLVRQFYGQTLPDRVRALFQSVPDGSFAIVEGMLSRRFHCPETSSLGRLFDAVAFLTGLCGRNDQEGRAAMLLESAATSCSGQQPYAYRLLNYEGALQLDAGGIVGAVCEDVLAGAPAAEVSRRFHETVASALSEMLLRESEQSGVRVAALSGGCFMNRILTERVRALLLAGGIERVLTHDIVPCGDAGLSLGQAVAAAEMVKRVK